MIMKQVLQPGQTQRITIIIDLAGVKFMDVVGESVAFLKTTVGMMSRHYPQRSFKVKTDAHVHSIHGWWNHQYHHTSI